MVFMNVVTESSCYHINSYKEVCLLTYLKICILMLYYLCKKYSKIEGATHLIQNDCEKEYHDQLLFFTF